MATFFLEWSEEEAPKKANCVPAIKWKLIFSNKDLKKTFLSRLDRARSSLSSSESRNVDNYRLLLSLLDHFKEEAGLDSDVVPSTTSPAQRKPMLKHSGISGSDVYEMVYCNVCVWLVACVFMFVYCVC